MHIVENRKDTEPRLGSGCTSIVIPIARPPILGKEEQGDHSQTGEPPDSMAKHSESTLFSPSALSSHPWNPSPTSQTPGFLFTSPPSPSAGPLVPHLPPGFHSFVPTTDSGPPSVVHRKCLQVLNDSGGNEGKWPLNLVLEENPKNISKLSFFLTER